MIAPFSFSAHQYIGFIPNLSLAITNFSEPAHHQAKLNFPFNFLSVSSNPHAFKAVSKTVFSTWTPSLFK